MVWIPDPPPRRPPQPAFAVWTEDKPLYRLHNPDRFGAAPASFRRYGPLARFDHQRGPNRSEDPDRGIAYAAPKLSSCIVEIFGDIGEVVCGNWHIAKLALNRPLHLLDLTGRNPMRIGIPTAISAHVGIQPSGELDYGKSQSWSRYIYETEGDFGQVDGLLYPNAHNGELALALYERCEDAVTCPPCGSIRLADDRRLMTKIRRIAHDHNMEVR